MQRLTVFAALVATVPLTLASGTEHCPPPGQHNPWFSLPPALTPVDDNSIMGQSTEVNPGEPDYLKISGKPAPQRTEDDAATVLPPFLDWGTDTLIGSTSTVPTWGKLSSDASVNGDIYVGVLDPSGTNEDTVTVWRSTDGGGTWSIIRRFYGNTSTGGIGDYVLRVGSDANGDWLYHFLLYKGSGTDGGLWVQRQRPPSGTFAWRQIVQSGDTLRNLCADRNIENPQHLFVGYQTTSNNVYLWSSKDTAQTWGNFTYITSDRREPALCAGADKYVYIACLLVSDSCRIRIGRNTNNLESGGTWTFVNSDSSADNRFYDLSVAADRVSAGASQTAIVLSTYRYNPNGNVGPRYSWTTNGGTSWSS
ncbi:MAG: hypothetical protein ABIL25_09560, partial [candidate division WOR-3 bacterium]